MSKIVIIVLVIFGIVLLLWLKPYDHNIPTNAVAIQKWGQDILNKSKYGLYPRKIYMISIPVLYINMDRNTDRKIFMENQFKKYNIKAERVQAIDGKETRFNHPELTSEELACTLSHLKAISVAEKNGYPHALIVEDDCCFDMLPFWSSSLENIMDNCPPDWEIIQLFSMNCSYKKELYVKKEDGKYCYGSVAYIINKAGMGKFNTSLIPNYSDRYIFSIATTYTYTIPILFPYNLTFDSTIHNSHTAKHVYTSKNIIYTYIRANHGVIPKIDNMQVKMSSALLDISRVLDTLGINFFLVDGTLLGAYREGKFISGDYDIDLGCFSSDIKSVFPITLSSKLKRVRQLGSLEYGYECTYVHKPTGVRIDIFLFYPIEGGYWSPTYMGICDKSKHGVCRWKNSTFDLGTLTFLGHPYRVPIPTERFLEEKYGKNWNIPISYDYFEGINKGHYRGLILSDFENENVIPQHNEEKIIDLWPRKIMESSKPLLWLYWEGKSKPPYIDICLQTIQKNCAHEFNIIILNDNKVTQLLRTVHKNFTNIEPIGMRSDYIRFSTIAEYGGLWLDSDTIVTKSLSFIPSLLKKYNFVGFEHDDFGDLSIGIFGGNPYNRICMYMKYLFETEFGYWKKYPYKVRWSAPTKKLPSYMRLLNRIYPNEYTTLYAPSTVYPVNWRKSKDYFWSEKDPDVNILNNYPAICLHNAMYGDTQKKMSVSEILNSNLCIAKIFRHVLK